MPDTAISGLTQAVPVAGDFVAGLDVSDATMSAQGSTRKFPAAAWALLAAASNTFAGTVRTAGYSAYLESESAPLYEGYDTDGTGALLYRLARDGTGSYLDLTLGSEDSALAPRLRLYDTGQGEYITFAAGDGLMITSPSVDVSGMLSAGVLAAPGTNARLLWNSGGQVQTLSALTGGTAGTHLLAAAQSSADVPLAAQASSGQTAAIQEWRDSSGSARLSVRLSGDRPVIRFADTSSDLGLSIQSADGTEVARFQDNGSMLVTSFGTAGGLNIFNFGLSRGTPNAGPTLAMGGGGEDLVSVTQGAGNNYLSTLALESPSTTTPGLHVRLKTGHTAHAVDVRNPGGTTLFGIDARGGVVPASMADSAAANGTLYYSTNALKLVFKDSGGIVNNLY